MLGLKNLSIAGRGGSSAWWDKMWSSYTQLNPGVYSKAIATEFKRRMKPDYVDSAGTGYYYNTFGPSGLNKTTADWIGIMVTSSATTARPNTKTGATLKWNLDGTIITQNNLPAYTKGANAGIITFTSTDGFSGVTSFDCSVSTLLHVSGLSSFVNLLVFYCSSNSLSNLTTYQWPSLTNFQCHGNDLVSLQTYDWVNMTTFYCRDNDLTSLVTRTWPSLILFNCYGNQLTSINNTCSNKISIDNEQNNLYPTTMVDSRLAYYNTMFAVTPPIKNLTLNLSGATMGIPTGAGSNTDLLGILAKFTAAGFTATIIVRTV